VVAILAVACTGCVAASIDDGDPTTTAELPDEAVIFEALTSDPEADTDEEPVLTVTGVCYAMCSPEASTPEYAL
jgi:hypothetical protein